MAIGLSLGGPQLQHERSYLVFLLFMTHGFLVLSMSRLGGAGAVAQLVADISLPTAEDSWAICRIFRKTNFMAQRALSRSWVSPAAETSNSSDIYSHLAQGTNFGSQSISCTSESGTAIQFCCNNELQQPSNLDDPSYKHMNPTAFCKPSFLPISATEIIPSASVMFAPPLDITAPPKPGVDFTSMLLNLSPSVLGEYPSRSSGSIGFGSHNNMGMYESGYWRRRELLPDEFRYNINPWEQPVGISKNTGFSISTLLQISLRLGSPALAALA